MHPYQHAAENPAKLAFVVADTGEKLTYGELDAASNRVAQLLRSRGLKPGDRIGVMLKLAEALAQMPTTPVADQVAGCHLLYSSGTTGRPKGIVHQFQPGPIEALSPAEGGTYLYERFDPLITFNAGPIYHGATENIGSTYIRASEWLAKPGSVGKSMQGAIHICDDEGCELPPEENGLIYFEQLQGRASSYLNDQEKTDRMRHPREINWLTVGDIGHVDDDGYLFLTDRKDFTIISGGVNIYPQMIEDAIILHPKVLDVAVIGIPNAEYGEEVKAIIQPKHWGDAGETLLAELRDWCRDKISSVNRPRSFELVRELPRLPSGKLAKHELRKRFDTKSACSGESL